MVQVDHIIKILHPERLDHRRKIITQAPPATQAMDLIDIGVGLQDGPEGRLCEIVHLRRNQLLFQAANDRSSKHDIPYAAKTYDQKFHLELISIQWSDAVRRNGSCHYGSI